MYHIREVVLKSKTRTRKRLVIEFDNPDQAIVGEFLMVDAPLDDWAILSAIDQAMDGKTPIKHISGNRFGADISAKKTYIYDLLSGKEDVPAYADYTINTETLRELVRMWKKYHEKC